MAAEDTTPKGASGDERTNRNGSGGGNGAEKGAETRAPTEADTRSETGAETAAETGTKTGETVSGSQAKFLSGDLMRHVATMSLASSVGLMALFLVDLADLYFISLLGQAELAAAIGYSGAILFFTTSVSIGMAIAMGALVARSLGAEDPERARLFASHVLAWAMLLCVFVTIAVWAFVPSLVGLLGAQGRTAELATQYLRIVVPTLPFMFCLMMGGAILRAHGDARRAMVATIVPAVVNAVMDPILIFGLGPIPALELEGAALASAMARIAGAIAAIAPVVWRYGGFAPIRLEALRADLRPIATIAFPAMLTNVATPIGAAVLTRLIASYGDAAVAGYAIVGRLTPVAFGVVFALSGAIGPIIGQNFGARKFDRVKGALTNALIFLGVYVSVVSLALFVGRGWIADAFGATEVGRDLVLWFCGPLALAFFFNGALFVANASFNNLERPFTSTIVNWGRHTLGTIPPAIVGAWLFGAPGVLIGQAVGGVLFAALAVWLAYRLVEDHASGRIVGGKALQPLWRWPQWPHSSPRA